MSDPILRSMSIGQCIQQERIKAEAIHGLHEYTDLQWLAILTEEIGEAAECVNVTSVPPIDEKLIEPAMDNLEYELIQIASVAIRCIKALRERRP